MVAEHPGRPEGYLGLGLVAEEHGRPGDALMQYWIVVSRWPERPEGHANLGRVLMTQGNAPEALPHLRRAAEARPGDPQAHAALARAHRVLGELAPALACVERALALDPRLDEVLAEKAQLLEMQGDADTAWGLLEPRVRGRATAPAVAHAFARMARRRGRADDAVALLEDLLKADRVPPAERPLLHHALAELYDAAGDTERAFAHYAEVHRVRAEDYDPEQHRDQVDRTIAAFSAARAPRLPRASNLDRLPVFVVGMPRSGTTLAEQIVASHPEAAGAGELPDIGRIAARLPRTLGVSEPFPACVPDLDRAVLDGLAEDHLKGLRQRFPDARRVTDKMPQNFLLLGLIALLFPAARVVHCVRDPVDTCLSCYFQYFALPHPYVHDLRALGLYYREYRRLMAHWKAVLDVPVLDLNYEALVAEPEPRTRELIEFLDLPWDEACLRFHENPREVGTVSYDQVRRPIYTGSVQRWRRYEKHLGPLLEALEGAS